MYRISIVSVVKIIVMFYKITSWFLYSEKYYVLIFLLLFNLFQKEFLKCLFRFYNSIQFFKWLFLVAKKSHSVYLFHAAKHENFQEKKKNPQNISNWKFKEKITSILTLWNTQRKCRLFTFCSWYLLIFTHLFPCQWSSKYFF